MAGEATKVFSLAQQENDYFGVAYAPPEIPFDRIWEGARPIGWEPVRFTLRDGKPADFQVNNLDWPLCSLKLRTIIEGMKGRREVIEWLPCTVDVAGASTDYYFLNLPERLSTVLDMKRSIVANGFVVKPVFLRAEAQRHRIFTYAGAQFRVFITQEVRDAIEGAGCQGVDFYERPTV